MRLLLKLGALLLAGALCGGPVDAGMVLSAAPAGGGGVPAGGTVSLAMTGSGMSSSSLACSSSGWSNTPTSFAYQFLRDGSNIAGATSTPYTAVTADQGHSITCTVIASNGSGPSSPATSGPQAVASCSQSASWFSQVWALPATLDQAHVGPYDAMICGLVTDAVWSKLTVVQIYATQAETVALLNLVSTSFKPTKHGSPTFTANNGYQPNATGDYIDTGFVPATGGISNSSFHASAWSMTNISGGSGGFLLGVNDGTSYIRITPKFTDGNSYNFVLSTSATTCNGALTTSSGYYVGVRFDANSFIMDKNGSGTAFCSVGSNAATALPNYSIVVPGENGSGTVSFTSPAFQVALVTIGASLGYPDMTALYNRFNTYLTAVRGSAPPN